MSFIEVVNHPLFAQYDVHVSVKRDDQIHAVVSGNKVFKLRYHLEAFKTGGYEHIASFGGPYSNHLHALAYVGYEQGIKTLGIIRGEQVYPLNHTLQDCVNWGMELIPIPRIEYKHKHESELLQRYLSQYESIYLVPEGGSGLLGVQGAEDILSGVSLDNYDYIVCACGTGTTVAGLISSIAQQNKTAHVYALAVLKAKEWLQQEISEYLNGRAQQYKYWQVSDEYCFGGYGKTPKELLSFMEKESAHLPLEPIYTAKAWYGLQQLVQTKQIANGSRVLFIHTGGLQGWR